MARSSSSASSAMPRLPSAQAHLRVASTTSSRTGAPTSATSTQPASSTPPTSEALNVQQEDPPQRGVPSRPMPPMNQLLALYARFQEIRRRVEAKRQARLTAAGTTVPTRPKRRRKKIFQCPSDQMVFRRLPRKIPPFRRRPNNSRRKAAFTRRAGGFWSGRAPNSDNSDDSGSSLVEISVPDPPPTAT